MQYPSDIVDQFLKLSPDQGLLAWKGEPVTCSHCARPIESEDLYEPSKVGPGFADNTRSLASTSQAICWRCVILRKKHMMYGFKAAVISADGVFPISKDIHKAWLFLTPPPAPFLVMHASSTMQHMSWRTPLTLDNQRIQVRFGLRLFTVRPAMIKQALEIADRINEGEKKFISPVYLDRKAVDRLHGSFTKRGDEKLTQPEREFFINLSAGERWALAYLMHSKRPVPEKPEPKTEKTLNPKTKTK